MKINEFESFITKFESMQIHFNISKIVISGIFPIQWPISSNNMCDI